MHRFSATIFEDGTLGEQLSGGRARIRWWAKSRQARQA
jgi:hypothetical protein